MAQITRYAAGDYPNAVLGTYDNLQQAINALPDPRTEPEIIEVEADNGVSETVPGFTYHNKKYSEHLCTIRPAPGHNITLHNDGAAQVISFATWATGNDNFGNFLIENFTISGEGGTNANAINISGAKSGGEGADIHDLTFRNITGNFINKNRVRIEHCDDIRFENCYFESDGTVVVFDADFNNYSIGEIVFFNCHIKHTGSEPDITTIEAAGDMIERITFNGCEIEGGSEHGIRLRFPQRLDIWRCKIHGQGKRGVFVNGKDTNRRTAVYVDNSVFWDQGDRAIVLSSHIEGVHIKQNTFIMEPAMHGFSCLDMHSIQTDVNIHGNIFARKSDYDYAPPMAFVRIRYEAGTIVADQDFNYNVYHTEAPQGNSANIRLYDIGVLSGETNIYTDLGDIQTLGLDTDSIEGDPAFSDDTYGESAWYAIANNSPARDIVQTADLSPFDIRRWYRQEYYQDAGCWDYDAHPDYKPLPDEEVDEFDIYRERDNKSYNNIGVAIIDQNNQTQNETIIIRTKGLGSQEKHPALWYAGRENTRGYVLTLKAHEDLVAQGEKVTIGSAGGLCANFDGVTNVVFENFHFEGNGIEDPYAFRINVKGGNNLIFKNCKFSKAKNPFYAVIANSLEFYDCEFTDCSEFCLNIAQGDRIIIDGCTFHNGSVDPATDGLFENWDNRMLLRMVMVLRSEIRNCVFDEPRIITVGKYDVGIYQLWYANTFKNIQWRTHWVVPGAQRNAGHIVFHSNVWENCAQTIPDNIFRSQAAEHVTFINNTIKHQVKDDIDVIYIREHLGKVDVFNNYFEIKRPGSYGSARLVRAEMDDRELGVKFKSDNNVFNIETDDEDNPTQLYRIGDSNQTSNYVNLAALQGAGLDLNSYEKRIETLDSLLETHGGSDYVPKANSDLIDNADLSVIIEPLDFEGNHIQSSPDIGAVTRGASPPVIETPVIDFSIIEMFEEPFTEHRYSQGITTPLVTPALDQIELTNKSKSFPQLITWRIAQIFDPVYIDTISHQGSNTKVTLPGNHMPSIGNVPVFEIMDSPQNNGLHERILTYYDEDGHKTVIILDGQLETSGQSGSRIHWENVPVGGVGRSVIFRFPHRDMIFDLYVKMENEAGYSELHIPLVWDVKTPRPIGSFRLSKYLVFKGDSVSFLSEVQYTENFLWEIETPTGLITETSPTVPNILFDQNGEYAASLELENVDGIKTKYEKDPAVFVEEIPSRPIIDFNSQNMVAHADQVIHLNCDMEGYPDAPTSRFLLEDEEFEWQILHAKTHEVKHTLHGKNVSFKWDEEIDGWGYYDVRLNVLSETYGGIQKTERRFLSIIPSIAGKTTHDIMCDPSDTYQEPGGVQTRTASLIMGTDPNQTGALNTQEITAGHVIRLSGQARELRLYDLYGTEENPIIVIPNYDVQDKFKVITQTFSGIETNRCEWVIVAGQPTNGVEEYGIEIRNNDDPIILSNTPGTSGFKVEKFSEHVHALGLEIDFIRFAGIMVKTNPDPDDPATWRNVGDPRMMGVVIGHCKVSNSGGEGIYTGHFDEGVAGTGSAASGMPGEPYYAQFIGDHIIFRSKWINCGFDGIQVGCAYLGENEVHHNDIINAGHLRVFGQQAGMSLNFIKGKIYNNRCESALIPKAGVPGEQWFFNNIITTLSRVDAFYFLCDETIHWDTSVSPPTIITHDYDYTNNPVRIFNNLIVTNRDAATFNARGANTKVPRIDMVNNIALFSPRAWKNDYEPENADRQTNLVVIQGAGSNFHLPQPGAIIKANVMKPLDGIGPLRLHDVKDERTIRGSIASDSPVLTDGFDLSGHYPVRWLFDYYGYRVPGLETEFHRGVMAWFPVNYDPDAEDPEEPGEMLGYEIVAVYFVPGTSSSN